MGETNMDNDLISRSELYAAIGKRIAERHGYFSLRDIKDAINNAPSVELERPQGEWVMVTVSADESGWKRAPVCNRCACRKPDNIGQTFSNNFCPNCGAKMANSAK